MVEDFEEFLDAVVDSGAMILERCSCHRFVDDFLDILEEHKQVVTRSDSG